MERGGARLAFAAQDGIEVIATGKLTTYPGRSKYQIVIESMELAGEGALMQLFERMKAQLAAEGLFDPARRRPIPVLPRVIGVVTSPTGAVIRDILHRLADRFPSHVVVWPVLVQGVGAAQQVAEAVRGFGAIVPGGRVPRPDLLIVARGGGSIEDLWAFNEEIVVRAVADSPIPVISAVGHETDTTLCDFAADLRAPTPTAAAEMAVPVRAELMALVSELDARMGRCVARGIERGREAAGGAAPAAAPAGHAARQRPPARRRSRRAAAARPFASPRRRPGTSWPMSPGRCARRCCRARSRAGATSWRVSASIRICSGDASAMPPGASTGSRGCSSRSTPTRRCRAVSRG